jgi:anti-anti-sigma regulatory factor
MNIAIIEDNADYVDLLRMHISEFRWNAEFFSSSDDFGKANLKKYDVIIADYTLPNSTNGRDLLKGIQSKTPAELFLMSACSNCFVEADIQNDNINGFIDKTDAHNVVDTLKYCDAKLRITKLIQSETVKFESIIANGFKIEMFEGAIILKITNTLSEASKRKILEKVDSNKITKIILSYPETKILKSVDLGVIVSLYNSLKKRKVQVVFWNIEKNPNIRNQLMLCKLDTLFPMFNTLEECLYELNSGVPA